MKLSEWIGLAIGVTGLMIGIFGIAYAISEGKKRAQMENIVKENLRSVEAAFRVIYTNALWSDQHVRHIAVEVSKAEPDLLMIKREMVDTLRDAASCKRQLSLAHNQIRVVQKSLFNDTKESKLELPSDDVEEAKKSMTNAPSAAI